MKACEICGAIHDLDRHHVIPKRMGGRKNSVVNDETNLMTLCRRCHRNFHQGLWELVRSREGIWVLDKHTGDLVMRRLYNPDLDTPSLFQLLNSAEDSLSRLFKVLPYLNDDQLVEAFTYASSFGKRSWLIRAAILYEAQQRSIYGDRMSSNGGGGYDWRLLWRLAIVAWLIGGIAMLTWVKSINYVRAAVATGEAVEHFQRGDLQATLTSLDRAIDLAPDVAPYYNYRAQVYFVYQLNQEAIQEKGCSLPNIPSYPVCLAKEAFQSNLDAVGQRPFNYRSHLALANLAFNLPELQDETIQFYEQSVALVPNIWIIRDEVAEAYIVAGQPEEAITALEESLAITKDTRLSARALFLRGQAYQDLDELQKSAESMERSLELVSKGETAKAAHKILAVIYTKLERPQLAEAHRELGQD